MADAYTNDLRLREQEVGANSGAWGGYLNTTLENIAESWSYGTEALADSATQTLTLADGASDQLRSFYVKLTGTLSQATTVTIAPNTISKSWMIENATSGGYAVTISQGSGANVSVGNGNVKMVSTDGAGSGAVVYDLFTDLELGALTQDGGAVFNEASADVDFRVESDNNANALFVQGSDGNVGIKTASPSNSLVVSNGGAQGIEFNPVSGLDSGSDILSYNRSTSAYVPFTVYCSQLKFNVGSSPALSMTIDTSGHVTMPLQPAFGVVSNADNTNIPTDAVGVVVNFGSTPIYDQNSDFTTATKLFTAPVTGKYQLSTNLYVNSIDDAAQYIRLSINTSNRLYSQLHDPRGFDQDLVRGNFNYSILADMDAGDTAKVEISQYEGTAQMDVIAGDLTIFTGVLVC
jgi:hypothetical protein